MIGAPRIAETWVLEGKVREIKGVRAPDVVPELKQVNAQESEALATAFLSDEFLSVQYERAAEKGKSSIARVFWTLKTTRPLWALFL